MKRLSLATLAISSILAGAAMAQQSAPSHAATDLPNYACMALNLPADQMMNPIVVIPIYSSPSSDSSKIGRASSIIIVSSPLISDNGFARVLYLNGQTGWINEKYIKTWTSPGGTGDHCFPALLSSGRIGFEFHK